MDRKLGILLLCCCLGCFLSGCNKIDSADVGVLLDTMAENGEQTSVLIQKDNTFTDVITESFSKEYYDFKELKEVIEEEISAYNTAHPMEESAAVPIELARVEEKKDTVVLALKYSQWETLQEYSADDAFADAQMTVQTVVNGMALEDTYVDVEGKTVNGVDLNSRAIQKGYCKVTASGVSMTVYFENPVICATQNVKILDAYTVQIPAEACCIITN